MVWSVPENRVIQLRELLLLILVPVIWYRQVMLLLRQVLAAETTKVTKVN